MNRNIELVELLKNQPFLDIKRIAKALNTNKANAWNRIHNVNKGKKFIKQNIKIVRSGDYGKSMYSLVSDDTSPVLIIHNINRYISSGINKIRRQRELGLVGQNHLRMKESLEELKNLIIQSNTVLNTLWTEAYYATTLPIVSTVQVPLPMRKKKTIVV